MIESKLQNKNPLIFSFPHSGYVYNKSFLKSTTLDINELRKSEDLYVDEMFLESLNLGYSYLKAMFPRVFIDVNRHPLELDPSMFSFVIKKNNFTDKSKINYGIGLISKYSVYGNKIYYDLLSKSDLRNRLLQYYFPYHNTLKYIIKTLQKTHKSLLILDCHSMPSNSVKNKDIDIVLGNNMGISISQSLFLNIKNIFIEHGFNIKVNKPYSGGFITKYYGNPKNGINVVQIEINRSKYIDEYSLEKNIGNMNRISYLMQSIVKDINKVMLKI